MISQSLSITRIFSSYKNDFNVTIKDAFNNIKNSKQFSDHQEYLTLETSFEEMTYLTSYETFGRLEDAINTLEMDNKSNFMKFQNVIQKMSAVMEKLRTNVEAGINALEVKSVKTTNLKTQIDSYRISSSLSNLNRVREDVRSYMHFFDLAKAFLSFGFQADVNYALPELTVGRMQEVLERKENEKVRKNMGILQKEREQEQEQGQKRERVERIVVPASRAGQGVDLNRVSIFCGMRSSQDTLGSADQYLEAVRKIIKKFFDELRQKNFIMTQFHFVLKDFVLARVKSEMESKQILYLITDDGEKVFPYELIGKMTEEFFRQNTREYHPTPADYTEQSNRIADSIFFEIANVENSLAKQTVGLSEEQKTVLILKNFNRDNIDLYRFLLPPQRTIETIVVSYLRKK
jgi:hypothetical protein